MADIDIGAVFRLNLHPTSPTKAKTGLDIPPSKIMLA